MGSSGKPGSTGPPGSTFYISGGYKRGLPHRVCRSLGTVTGPMRRPGIDPSCESGNPVEMPLRGFENRCAKDQAQQLRPPKAPSLGAGASSSIAP